MSDEYSVTYSKVQGTLHKWKREEYQSQGKKKEVLGNAAFWTRLSFGIMNSQMSAQSLHKNRPFPQPFLILCLIADKFRGEEVNNSVV